MFCPKCGSQNADGTKFCRGCGADVGNVLAAIEGRVPEHFAQAEKQIDHFSRGVRGLVIGIGFLIVSGVAFGVSMRLGVLGVFALAFAFFFLGTGVSRLIQARSLKALRSPKKIEPTPALAPGEPEYLKPARSIYDTDDLVSRPGSITEHTTTHLKKDDS